MSRTADYRGLWRTVEHEWGAYIKLGASLTSGGRGENYGHACDCLCNYRLDARWLHGGDTGACDTGWLEWARQTINGKSALPAGEHSGGVQASHRPIRAQGSPRHHPHRYR